MSESLVIPMVHFAETQGVFLSSETESLVIRTLLEFRFKHLLQKYIPLYMNGLPLC